jgi:diguanylate cyclase (GGDEF)-like protein
VALENARRFEEAHYLAHRDPVTGLLNHRGMNARLEEERARCDRVAGNFSVVMMDLDSFKLFNDTYGHAVGDEVLSTVARVLRQTARASDIVARYGGEPCSWSSAYSRRSRIGPSTWTSPTRTRCPSL